MTIFQDVIQLGVTGEVLMLFDILLEIDYSKNISCFCVCNDKERTWKNTCTGNCVVSVRKSQFLRAVELLSLMSSLISWHVGVTVFSAGLTINPPRKISAIISIISLAKTL